MLLDTESLEVLWVGLGHPRTLASLTGLLPADGVGGTSLRSGSSPCLPKIGFWIPLTSPSSGMVFADPRVGAPRAAQGALGYLYEDQVQQQPGWL